MQTKTYNVHRTMQDGAKEYLPGDTREMTPADAAELVSLGALSLAGEDPAVREPSVRHTFGSQASAVNDAGYTVAGEAGAITAPVAPAAVAAPASKTARAKA